MQNRHVKTKAIIIICIVAIAYYIAFFTLRFTVFENFTLSPAKYEISESCIIVHGQATTGPDIGVVEGAEFIRAAIPLPHPDNLVTSEIIMTGKSIYEFFDYPDYYACNWLVYGKVIGTTCSELWGGVYPVFESEKVYPIMPLSDFVRLEVIMFAKPPLGFLAGFVLYLWPIVVILVLLLTKKRRN